MKIDYHHLKPIIFSAVVLFVGIVVSEWFNLPNRFYGYDKMFHFLGGLGVAWTVAVFMEKDLHNWPWHKKALILLSVTAFVGLIWEFAEYLSNSLENRFPVFYRYFSGGDLADTIGDLISDLLGATAFMLNPFQRFNSE